jgi:hypothetical protein
LRVKNSLYAKTKDYLRSLGYPLVEKTENWNSFAYRHNDLFGFVDFLAVSPEHGTLALQVTSFSNRAARKKKILEHKDEVEILLQAGWRIAVLSWKKKGRSWTPDLLEITHEMLSE